MSCEGYYLNKRNLIYFYWEYFNLSHLGGKVLVFDHLMFIGSDKVEIGWQILFI